MRGAWGWVALSVLLGALTIGSNAGLMGTSAYLISAAALHPDISMLEVAIVGVRFFGIARGVFRYLERLVSHNVTFRLLASLRVWFYSALEPLAPARLMQFRSGDLLSRIVADIDALENYYVRVVAPPLVALVVAAATGVYLAVYDPRLAQAFLLFIGADRGSACPSWPMHFPVGQALSCPVSAPDCMSFSWTASRGWPTWPPSAAGAIIWHGFKRAGGTTDGPGSAWRG